MKVPHDEGVANHIDPESCAAARQGPGEALTGERIGQPSPHFDLHTLARSIGTTDRDPPVRAHDLPLSSRPMRGRSCLSSGNRLTSSPTPQPAANNGARLDAGHDAFRRAKGHFAAQDRMPPRSSPASRSRHWHCCGAWPWCGYDASVRMHGTSKMHK